MKSQPIKVVVVEDEPDLRRELIEGLEEDPVIKVCGEAESVEEAYEQIRLVKPDAIFLDVKLVEGNGFDLLRKLKANNIAIPPVVLNTGYEKFEYAQTAFNDFRDEIIHILQKPFFDSWETKRRQCLDSIIARKKNEDESKLLSAIGLLSIRHKNQTYFVNFEEILFLEVGGNGYIYVVARDGREILLKQSMISLLKELPAYIIQISRFNAVNLNFIHRIDHEKHSLQLRGKTKSFEIGDGFYSNLMEILK